MSKQEEQTNINHMIIEMKDFTNISRKSYLVDLSKYNRFLAKLAGTLNIQNRKMQLSEGIYHENRFISICIVGKECTLSFNIMNKKEIITLYIQTTESLNNIVDSMISEMIADFNPMQYRISILSGNHSHIRLFTKVDDHPASEYKKKTLSYKETDIVYVEENIVTEKENIVTEKENIVTEKIDNKLPDISWFKKELLQYAELHDIKINKFDTKQNILDKLLNGE